ncbi:RNA polymerase sigma factor [Micromonospora aurantiaca (nom. illeg.)]|uniref:RNA polymerase sigma factor n=1 Tax=Micromonospora aurantiaca (nom. illeg.) TaxID=47850 RepID=UPI0036519E74
MARDQVELPPPESGSAFDNYYRSDSKRLFSFLLKLGATIQEAEDASQDAWEEVFTRWDVIGSTNPAAYARTVAEQRFIRSRARTKSEHEKLMQAGWATERPFADTHYVLLKDEAQRLIKIMQGLPYAQRRVLAWSIDGFKNAEIAEAIEQPVATVRSNLRHAKDKVKAAVAAQRTKNTSSAGRKEAGK